MTAAPDWIARADRALAEAARHVRLLGAVTPSNVVRERARLIAAFEAGRDAAPRWSYPSVDSSLVRGRLEAAEQALSRCGPGGLVQCYRARARELDLEAELSALAGTAAFGARARDRFSAGAAAGALAREWLAATTAAPEPEAMIISDDDDPRSLLSRMRADVGRARLPFSVVARAGLSALAATGHSTIFVASGRRVSEEDAVRTVLHEVLGHASPRVRAASQPIGIFAFGTARGADDQEGRALLLEDRRGFLTPRRKRQLAARHVAVRQMLDGADFVTTARTLINDHAFAAADAVLIAERAFRGGDGSRGGLGREQVYLDAFARAAAWLEARPDDEPVMAQGQIALSEIETVRPYAAL